MRRFGPTLLATGLLTISCKGGDSTGPKLVPTSVTLTASGSTVISAGSQLQVTATVRDQNGQPISGGTVTFHSSDEQIGVVSNTGVLTSIGPVGSLTITARSGTITSNALLITVVPGAPATIEKLGGDPTVGLPGDPLSDSIRVVVKDAKSNRVPGATVTFAITAGGGSVSAGTVTTNAEGVAAARVVTGAQAGLNSVTASIAGGQAVSFAFTTVPPPPAAVEKLAPEPSAGLPGDAVSDSIRVIVKDVRGNPVPGATVTFTVTAGGGSVSPPSVATSAQGVAAARVVTGPQPGVNSVSASITGGHAVTFSFTTVAPPAGAVVITSITPGLLMPGIAATINGTGFSATAGQNTVTVDGVTAAVAAASTTQLLVTLPLTMACQPTHAATVSVTVAGSSATTSHPLATAVQRTLSVGQSLLLTSADASRCNELSQTGGRYLISVMNTSATPTGIASFRLRGGAATALNATALLAPPDLRPQWRRRSSSGEGAAMAAIPDRLERARLTAHFRIVEENRAVMAGLSRTSGALRGGTRTRASVTSSAVVPTVGDTRALRVSQLVPGETCTQFSEITARIAYVGTKSVIYEDVAAPLARTMDDHFRFIGEEFDNVMYGIVTTNFGDPTVTDPLTDVDGRIAMVFTPAVTSVRGFVSGCDFFPRDANNPSSNMGEFFYAQVPTTATGGFSNSGSVETWRWQMRATVIHEVKHIASLGARFITRRTAWEESWIEEGTARHAEELYARQAVYSREWKTNIGYGSAANPNSVYCDVRPTWSACPDKPYVMMKHFSSLYQHLTAPSSTSLFGPAREDDAAYYAIAWSFVRWIIDRHASSEAAFLKSLTQGNQIGLQNLSARAGRSAEELMAAWTLALYTDDFAGAGNADLHIATWNLRDVFSGMNADFPTSYPRSFPLMPQQLTFGNFNADVSAIHGGGSAYFELTGSQAAKQLIELQSSTGGSPAGILRLAIARIQ